MLYLYRISIWLYQLIIFLMAPIDQKAKNFHLSRKGVFQRLEKDIRRGHQKLVWMHVASLGEFEQGRPILEQLKEDYPDLLLLVTFFSPSGYEVRKNYPLADYIHYLPMDSPGNSKRFISLVKPDLVIFVKYEFWYHYLVELEERAIPILMTSAIFRTSQLFFHWLGKAYLPALRAVTHYFVQDERSGALLRLVGIRNWTLAGDTRFDRVVANADKLLKMRELDEFVKSSKVMILGSVWSSDMYFLEPFMKNHLSELKFIIAPHTIEEEILVSLDALGNSIRYSEIGPQRIAEHRVLIIDNIGMLASLYAYGDFAYVGGGFRGALHNLLEAAAYGMPIFFGEHSSNEKFLEAAGLVTCGGAFAFSDLKELEQLFDTLQSDPLLYAESSNAAHEYVLSHCGGTAKIMERIAQML